MPTLHWLTRETDLKASGLAPYRLLDHVETYGDAHTENMLIQGDNLDALKALLQSCREEYKSNEENAKQLVSVGLAAQPEGLSASEAAAWTMVCRSILNLHEFTTRN